MRVRGSMVASAALAGALLLASCGSDDGAAEGDEASAGEVPEEDVTLSFLVDNTELTLALAEGLAEEFTDLHPNITINVETRPGGGEGDNIVKTRLATGDMTDIFMYNSGSLFQALNPEQTLVPITDEDFVDDLSEAFVPAVTSGDDVYAAPFGSTMGGGILYNVAIYDELGLDVPLTWDDFMSNNEAIAAAGDVAPVIQTYQDTWTSQLFVLADFHNVSSVEPEWAERYTAGEEKYADSEVAIKGFQRLESVHDAGYLNEDFAAATYSDGLRMLAEGEGAHYPMLTFAVGEIASLHPDELDDVGFFAQPGDDADTNGLTAWSPAGVYIPQTTEGAQRDAAKAFLAFVGSTEGCEAQTRAIEPSGPYGVVGCDLPEDLPRAVLDMLPYFEQEGATSPALEFVSPLKGPLLEQITVEVGSGIRSAEDGAAVYDEDVVQQAEQLGLEGW